MCESVLRSTTSCCILLAAFTASGCGTSVDRAQVRTTAQRFADAVARHDGATACAQLSPTLRTQLVKDESATCTKAILQLQLDGRRATDVRVYATSAIARLVGGDTMFLSDTAQGWRLDAIGCRAKAGAPYDCEEDS
jgi:hypothetical protein